MRDCINCFHNQKPCSTNFYLDCNFELEIFRASGDCICSICGKEYWKHKLSMEYLGYNDEPYLNRLCDGRLVKL